MFDPRPSLRRVRCPVLSIIGERDMQVSAEENNPAIREAFAAGGNGNVTVTAMCGLNHLLQSAVTGSPSEYDQIRETMSPEALDAMTDWILTRLR